MKKLLMDSGRISFRKNVGGDSETHSNRVSGRGQAMLSSSRHRDQQPHAILDMINEDSKAYHEESPEMGQPNRSPQ